jgi:hypothetical protein
MMAPEKGLLQEVTPLLLQFKAYKTHLSTKHDREDSTERFAVSNCIVRVSKCNSPAPTTYAPTGLVTVRMNKQEVSSDIEATIRIAVNSTELHHYMQLKYKWHDTTIDKIDWILLSMSLRSLTTNQRKTITQFMHGWLPVNGHPGRAECQFNQTCPMCRETLETQDHFLTCKNTVDRWNQAVTAIVQSIQEKYPHLSKILHWALTTCRGNNNQQPPDRLITTGDTTQHIYDRIIRTQTSIGWQQILKGRWAVSWVQAIEIISPGQGERETTKIISHIWQEILSIWKERCNILHADTLHNNERILQNILPRVQAIYERKDKLDAVDKQVLATPIAKTLQLPQRLLLDWVRRTGNFVKKGLKRANHRLKERNNSITQYFHRTLPPLSFHTDTVVHNTNIVSTPPNRHNKENHRPP